MPLVGRTYIQDSDPGAVGYGYEWLHSNGTLKTRNATNTAWVTTGNVLTNYNGLVPVSGATMTGALNGVTGWAPVASPDFTTSAKRAGIDLVDQNQLTTAINNLNASIDDKVQSAVSTLVKSGTAAGVNIAVASGTLTPATPGGQITIPLPAYSDGTTAAESECKWSLSVRSIPDQGNGLKLVTVTQVSGRTYTAIAQRDDLVTSVVTLDYMIIGIRS